MTVALLLASSRSAGNTRTLVDLAFPSGAHLFEDLHTLRVGYYSYENANAEDDFLPLVQRLMPHNTWVIATPLYWYSMSAQAKTFLDRLSDLLSLHKDQGCMLRGKRLAVLCSGTDPQAPKSFSEPFQLTCDYLGMKYLGTHYAQFQGLYPAQSTARLDAESFARSVVHGDA
jgi:multimeric flavodoxin WrbA